MVGRFGLLRYMRSLGGRPGTGARPTRARQGRCRPSCSGRTKRGASLARSGRYRIAHAPRANVGPAPSVAQGLKAEHVAAPRRRQQQAQARVARAPQEQCVEDSYEEMESPQLTAAAPGGRSRGPSASRSRPGPPIASSGQRLGRPVRSFEVPVGSDSSHQRIAGWAQAPHRAAGMSAGERRYPRVPATGLRRQLERSDGTCSGCTGCGPSRNPGHRRGSGCGCRGSSCQRGGPAPGAATGRGRPNWARSGPYNAGPHSAGCGPVAVRTGRGESPPSRHGGRGSSGADGADARAATGAARGTIARAEPPGPPEPRTRQRRAGRRRSYNWPWQTRGKQAGLQRWWPRSGAAGSTWPRPSRRKPCRPRHWAAPDPPVVLHEPPLLQVAPAARWAVFVEDVAIAARGLCVGGSPAAGWPRPPPTVQPHGGATHLGNGLAHLALPPRLLQFRVARRGPNFRRCMADGGGALCKSGRCAVWAA